MADFRPDDPRASGGQSAGPQLGNPNMVSLPNSRSGVGGLSPTWATYDDTIPQFLNEMVKPYVEAKQNEQFVKGMSDQMIAGAETEMLDHNASFVDKIFGPTSYREGASFFRAQSAVENWETGMQGRMDELKRLPPEDLNKVVAQEMQGLGNTGDQWVDGMIQQSMVKKLGPLLNTVAKERLEMQQYDARQTHTGMVVDAAASYHAIAARQMRLANPTEQDTAAEAQAQQNMYDLWAKPAGMTDKAWRASMKDAYTLSMEKGNFFAVEAMRKAGLVEMFDLDPKDIEALDNKYNTYADRSLKQAYISHAGESDEIYQHQKIGDWSPAMIRSKLMKLNQDLRRETGVDRDYYDGKELDTASHDLIAAKVSRAERNENRMLEQQDRLHERELDQEDKRLAAQVKLEAVGVAFRNGTINTESAKGNFTKADADDYAVGMWAKGDVTGVVQAFDRQGFSSPTVKSTLQAPIKASIGVGYTKDAERAYGQYQAISKISQSAAAEYYGDTYLQMTHFDAAMRGGMTDPALAWKSSFEDPATEQRIRFIDPKQAKATGDAVRQFVANDLPKASAFGASVTPSGQRLINGVVFETAARLSNASGMDPKVAVKIAYDQGIKNGSFEHYGKYAWTNGSAGQHATPLNQLLDLKGPDMESLLNDAVEAHKKAHDIRNVSDWFISRRPDEQGKGDITISFFDNKGSHFAPVTITLADLQARSKAKVKTKMDARHVRVDPTIAGVGTGF